MIVYVKHPYTKFVVDPIDPAQLTARKVMKNYENYENTQNYENMGFLNGKTGIFLTSSNDVTTFWTS